MPHQCTTCGNVFDDGSKEMLGGCPECGGNTFQFHPAGADVPADPPDTDPPEPEGSSTANTVGRAATKVRDFVSRDSADSGAADAAAVDGPGGASNGRTARSPGESSGTAANTDSDGGTPTASTSAELGSDGPDPNRAWPSEESDPDDPLASGGDDSDIIDADAREAARARQAAEDGTQTAAREELASDDEVSTGTAPTEAATAGSTGSDGYPTEDDDAGSPPAAGAGGLEAAENGASDAPGEGRVVSEPSENQPDLSELREQLNDQFESIKILEPGQYELNLMELYDREEYIIALQENGRYVIQVPEQWLGDEPGA